jgi:hypothetical protein
VEFFIEIITDITHELGAILKFKGNFFLWIVQYFLFKSKAIVTLVKNKFKASFNPKWN